MKKYLILLIAILLTTSCTSSSSSSGITPSPSAEQGSLGIDTNNDQTVLDYCSTSSTQCQMTVTVKPVTQSNNLKTSSRTFTIDHTKLQDSKLFTDYDPGSYQIAVDSTSLPPGVQVKYSPANPIITIAKNTTQRVLVSLTYTHPASLGQVTITLTNPNTSAFQNINNIPGNLTDNSTGASYPVILSLGQSYVFNNLPMNHTYSIWFPGIVNPATGNMYEPLTANNLTPTSTGSSLSNVLTYVQDNNSRAVNFNISYDVPTGSNQTLSFSDVDNVFDHVYTNVTLPASTSSVSYHFPSSQSAKITLNNIPGNYTGTISPTSTITSNISNVSVAFAQLQNVGNITINLNNPNSAIYNTQFGSVTGVITDTTNNNTYNFSISPGSSYTLQNVPNSHTYTAAIQGISSPADNSFYSPISATTVNIGNNNLNYVANSNTFPVVLSVSPSQSNLTVSFADQNTSQVSSYKYKVNTLSNSTIYFISGTTTSVVAVTPITGYTSTITPKTITSSINQLNIQYTQSSSTLTYQYIAPFKDYNNKVTLSFNNGQTAQSIVVTSNFNATFGWGTCFGLNSNQFTFATTQVGQNYLSTLTATGSNVFNIANGNTCDLMGTNSGTSLISVGTFAGVTDPIVSSVSISTPSAPNTNINADQPCMHDGSNCVDPGNGYVHGTYFADWSVWARSFNPYNIPFNRLNRIYYAFIGFDPTSGHIKQLDASADSWGLSAITRARIMYPYLKAELSFGGWTNNGVTTAPMFMTLVSNPTAMNNFIADAIQLMRTTKFSGIDIDWEWWSDYSLSQAPAQQQYTFFNALSQALQTASAADGVHYTLSIAVNVSPSKIDAMEDSVNNPTNYKANFWRDVSALVDNIDIMAYDVHGGFDTGNPASFQAPWNLTSDNPYYSQHEDISHAIADYTSRNAAASKLIVGIPLYARTMSVATSPSNYSLFNTVSGTAFGDYEPGILDYKCLTNPVVDPVNGCGSSNPVSGLQALSFINSTHNTNNLWNQYGLVSYQPWGYSSGVFVTYDDVLSAYLKTTAVRTQNLGGVMTWEIDGDSTNPSLSITNSIYNALNS